MKHLIIGGLTASLLALPGCYGMTRQESMVVGGLTGAALGVVTADMLDANRNWTIIAALAGAAVGTQVAVNNATNECAYARADGRYTVRPCY
ncbi:glucose-6-phosphate isomerase [Thalassovita aquimarina]|uniref:Glucose-6-phosphate isomerase n=1 Tax=Thalassovita aquimarina TaxID=2785917 RepID=A0ABS5HWN3_9RHOB|nr:glucose-6-phosphate isomerase [Thalassovita aquimarina]MBR9653382.1 glucose-6-phosphate isomerase [Thalassovita aquimarina]